MASVIKTSGGYRAQVCVSGRRASASFRTKREAEAWAASKETELRASARLSPAEKHTLRDTLEKYRDEVSPGKRGRRWEEIRIEAFLRSPLLPTDYPLSRLDPAVLGVFRDERLKQVGAGTVLREIGLLSAVLEEARREWRWISSNPIADIRKPRAPDHREVVIAWPQIKAMLGALGYAPGKPVRSVSHAVALAFLVALRTGMRAGELCSLTWDNVFADYCRLPVTKTTPRDVPLEPKVLRLIGRMRGFDDRLVFGLSAQSLDALFRKARSRAGLAGFTFHDARHTAATWMARRLDVLTLCKMFGWRNPKMAMTYYNPTASDIARQLSLAPRR